MRPDRGPPSASRGGAARALRPSCGSALLTVRRSTARFDEPFVQVDEGGLATPAGPRPVGSTVRLRHWRRTLSAVPGPTAARGGRSRPCGRAGPGVPARPVAARRRGRPGARSGRVARSTSGRPSCIRGWFPFSSPSPGEAAGARTRRTAWQQKSSSSSPPSDVDCQRLVAGVTVLQLSSALQDDWRLRFSRRVQAAPQDQASTAQTGPAVTTDERTLVRSCGLAHTGVGCRRRGQSSVPRPAQRGRGRRHGRPPVGEPIR